MNIFIGKLVESFSSTRRCKPHLESFMNDLEMDSNKRNSKITKQQQKGIKVASMTSKGTLTFELELKQ